MDNRQSSLPSSLIPHLYSAPRNSSTRTTLDHTLHHRDHHPVSPVFPQLSLYPPQWREGEPGPSHLRRGASQPPARAPDLFTRHDYQDFQRESERDTYWPPVQHQPSVPYNIPHHTFQALPPPQHLLIPPNEGPSSSFAFDRHDAYTYPPVGSLSISAPTSAHPLLRSPDSPELYYHYRSDSRSAERASTDEADSQRSKRRRAESLEPDDTARKSRNPRKTAVACNFCRGRKLRCNGAKPSCYNCTVRKFECEYVPIQRRRGPGKAPKGSRSKKAASSRADAPSSKNPSDRPPSAVPDYELDALAPELRPYTSVLSLDSFGFQPPDLSPHYPSLQDPRLMRDYYMRARTPRSRETSSDDLTSGLYLHFALPPFHFNEPSVSHIAVSLSSMVKAAIITAIRV
ncbi:hypothetical protein GALMADRAFT_134361 [Galerina marginata CBS 339.88]|uniref:Zn(2)-C6 fungal-type domain-containing protein n=1 Tax=Galerina marginata (strain CBS 339.88) TaxID=685588 RepID=A0A067TKE6_GALM3|nr:hypothetical protein GALMADRAFT_134361 [Galerina marginata CBS 339.88]